MLIIIVFLSISIFFMKCQELIGDQSLSCDGKVTIIDS